MKRTLKNCINPATLIGGALLITNIHFENAGIGILGGFILIIGVVAAIIKEATE